LMVGVWMTQPRPVTRVNNRQFGGGAPGLAIGRSPGC
jgi:hypothetical protein